jgi:hypothetical protein
LTVADDVEAVSLPRELSLEFRGAISAGRDRPHLPGKIAARRHRRLVVLTAVADVEVLHLTGELRAKANRSFGQSRQFSLGNALAHAHVPIYE